MKKEPMFVPRFRGMAYQPEGSSAWSWEIIITIGPTGEDHPDPICMGSKETFINRDAALKNMKAFIPGLMRETCKAMGLPEPEAVQDLKAGTLETMKDWEEHA